MKRSSLVLITASLLMIPPPLLADEAGGEVEAMVQKAREEVRVVTERIEREAAMDRARAEAERARQREREELARQAEANRLAEVRRQDEERVRIATEQYRQQLDREAQAALYRSFLEARADALRQQRRAEASNRMMEIGAGMLLSQPPVYRPPVNCYTLGRITTCQ